MFPRQTLKMNWQCFWITRCFMLILLTWHQQNIDGAVIGVSHFFSEAAKCGLSIILGVVMVIYPHKWSLNKTQTENMNVFLRGLSWQSIGKEFQKTTKESGCQLKLFIFTPKSFSGVVNCLTTSELAKSVSQWNVLHLLLFDLTLFTLFTQSLFCLIDHASLCMTPASHTRLHSSSSILD